MRLTARLGISTVCVSEPINYYYPPMCESWPSKRGISILKILPETLEVGLCFSLQQRLHYQALSSCNTIHLVINNSNIQTQWSVDYGC